MVTTTDSRRFPLPCRIESREGTRRTRTSQHQSASASSSRMSRNSVACEVRYVIPKGTAMPWFDLKGIPKDAPHPEAAMQRINYILQPKVSAALSGKRSRASPTDKNQALFSRSDATYCLAASLPCATAREARENPNCVSWATALRSSSKTFAARRMCCAACA